MKKLLIALAVLLSIGMAFAQTPLLYDDFTGLNIANLAGQSSWTKAGSGPDPTVANTTPLTYTGYNGGGAEYVQMPTPTGTSARVYKGYTSTAPGTNTFFYSVLVRLSATTATGDYFLSLGDPAAGTTYFARLFAKTSGTGFVLGGSKLANVATANFGTTVLSYNQTYLVVVRYTFLTGGSNDLMYVWVDPSLSSEPATGSAYATVTASLGDGTPANVGNFHWHNRTVSNPSGAFDGVRVAYGADSATAWTNLNANAVGIVAPTTQASAITFANVGQNQMDVSWTNGNGAKRVVLINTANTFTAPTDGTDPTANTIYGGAGQQVVYNNSGSTVTVTALDEASTYWFRVYEYNGSGATTKYLTTTATNNPNSQATAAGAVIPTVTTAAITAITNTSAYSGGNVTSDGGDAVTAYGVCWNTGGSPDLNDDFTDDGTGTGTYASFIDGLAAGQLYYVRAYATNGVDTAYGNELSFTTLKNEPSDHVVSFTVTTQTTSSLTLTWADAAKVTPDGYLVKGSSIDYNDITAPTDGTTEANSALVRNVTQGTQTYTFTGLNDNTTYYFKIYPYTNSGTGIDYKVNGAVPQASGTTLDNFDLSPGDIAIIGYEGDSPDKISIILLVDIPAGTLINITDNGFNNLGALNTTEGTISWTVPAGGLTAGTIVNFTGDTWAVDLGSLTTTGSLNLATGGDQILIYQGASTTPTFIYAITTLPWVTSSTISSNTTYLPTGLTDGVNAFAFTAEFDNGFFNVIPFTGTVAELLAAIADETNWSLSNTAVTFPSWDITLDEEALPVELSSFTAVLSATNYVNLTWVTQTETGVQGYYIYRAESSQLEVAQMVSPMISATNTSQQQSYVFADTELFATGTYYYWLQNVDFDGSNTFHGPVSVYFTSEGDNPTPDIPLVTQLNAIYPNPFNPATFIPFSIATSSDVSFKIYNSRGQIVKLYDLGIKAPGNYRIEWNGTDYNGQPLANGVYYVKMLAGKNSYQAKAVLLK